MDVRDENRVRVTIPARAPGYRPQRYGSIRVPVVPSGGMEVDAMGAPGTVFIPKSVRDAAEDPIEEPTTVEGEGSDPDSSPTPEAGQQKTEPDTATPEVDEPVKEAPKPDEPVISDQERIGRLESSVKHAKDVAKSANGRNKDLAEELRQAKSDAETLREQLAVKPAAAEQAVDLAGLTPEQMAERYDLSEDELEVGPDGIAMAAKVAQKHVKEAVEAAVKPFEERLNALQERSQQSQDDSFYTALLKAMPDYLALDHMPEWDVWLKKEDLVSGEKRETLLARALHDGRAASAAELFERFRKEQGIVPVQAEQVSGHVMPDQAAASVQNVPQGKTYTVKEHGRALEALGRDQSLTLDKKEAKLAELDAAMSEGRVQG